MEKSFSESYKEAGVDITAGYKAVELMKEHVAKTMVFGNVPEDTITINVSSVGFELKEVELYNYSCPLHIILLEGWYTFKLEYTMKSRLLQIQLYFTRTRFHFFHQKKKRKYLMEDITFSTICRFLYYRLILC